MPFKLVEPRLPLSPYWRVRGTEFGRYLNISTKCTSKADAAKFLKRLRDAAKSDFLAAPDPHRGATFADAAIAYLQGNGERRYLLPLIKHFGDWPISKIDQAAIDAAAVALYPNASPATRNRQVYSPVSAVLRRFGIAMTLRRPIGAHSGRRVDWLRPEQAFALLDASGAIHGRFGALVTFLLYTGVRLSEALRLEWKDIDLEHAVAYIGKTKNGEPLTTHLPQPIIEAISGLDRARRRKRVFGLWKDGNLYQWWGEAERQAGIELPPGSAFHVLRHTYGVYMRRFGGLDTSALIATGRWKSRDAASRYEHVDISESQRAVGLFPMPSSVKAAQ